MLGMIVLRRIVVTSVRESGRSNERHDRHRSCHLRR
jgi:hypothetical protein